MQNKMTLKELVILATEQNMLRSRIINEYFDGISWTIRSSITSPCIGRRTEWIKGILDNEKLEIPLVCRTCETNDCAISISKNG